MDFFLHKPFLRRLAIALAMIVVLTACGTAAFQHDESRLTFRVVRETPAWYTGMPDGVQEFNLPVEQLMIFGEWLLTQKDEIDAFGDLMGS